MNCKPGDEFAANLFEAQRQWGCNLEIETAEELIETVSARYVRNEFEKLLDEACDRHALEGRERRAYKMALGLLFGTRAQVRLLERREGLAIPFAPK